MAVLIASSIMDKKQIGFQLPDEKLGVRKFEVVVEATDKDEALGIFLGYITELKRRYIIPPEPIANQTPGQVGYELLKRLSWVSEPVAYILTLHLFCEHWLNQILMKYIPNRDVTRYDFFKKLELAFGMDKIPKGLFINLCKLNELRKEVAHNPNYDLTTMDLAYVDCDPDFEMSKFRPSYHPEPRHNHIYNVLHGVSFVTYHRLHQHCIENLGFYVEGDKRLTSEKFGPGCDDKRDT